MGSRTVLVGVQEEYKGFMDVKKRSSPSGSETDTARLRTVRKREPSPRENRRSSAQGSKLDHFLPRDPNARNTNNYKQTRTNNYSDADEEEPVGELAPVAPRRSKEPNIFTGEL